jgi:hypothetical protein
MVMRVVIILQLMPSHNPAMKSDAVSASSLSIWFGSRARFFQFAALTCGSATLFGFLASTGNFMMVGAAFGTIVAPFLLVRTKTVLSVVIIAGISAGAIISIVGPGLTVLSWVISLLSFSLLPLALFRLCQKPDAPGFIWLTLGFLIYSLVITVFQWHTLDQLVAGSKRYFQGYGVMFGLAATVFSSAQIQKWRRNFVGLAILQLPFAIWEFVVLVPLRGGLDAGGEATDVVAGTFGANLEGGSANAEMSAFVLIVFIFCLVRWRAGLITKKNAFILSSLCLAPLTLGETKIVVILLPVMVFVVLRKGFMANPLRHSASILTCAVLTVVLAYVYITVMDRDTVSNSIESSTKYNLGTVGYGQNLLNRMTVLTFWWSRHSLANPVEILFGHGLGSSFWGDNSPIPGNIAVLYPNYGINLTTASTLLWDLGIVGLAFHIVVFIAAWVAANKLWAGTSDKSVQSDALGIQAAIACFAIFIFYRDSGVNLLAYEIICSSVLGYLAYLYRTSPQREIEIHEVNCKLNNRINHE